MVRPKEQNRWQPLPRATAVRKSGCCCRCSTTTTTTTTRTTTATKATRTIATRSSCGYYGILILASSWIVANGFVPGIMIRKEARMIQNKIVCSVTTMMPPLFRRDDQRITPHYDNSNLYNSKNWQSCLTAVPTRTRTLLFGSSSLILADRAVAVASLTATAKLLSSIALGGWAAKQPNVLDAAAVSALSRLTYWVFQPAFLLSSVGKTLANAATGGQGGLPTRYLALMPLTALLQIALGSLVGILLTRHIVPPGVLSAEEQRDVRVCTAFANSGPLPLIFTDALFAGSALQADAVSCISFYLLVWSPLFWSLGRIILGTYGSDDRTAESTAMSSWKRRVIVETKRILSPPVIGCLVGILAGAVPLLRSALILPGGLLVPLFGAIQTLGTAYLPAAILVLAGSLVGNKTKPLVASSASSVGDKITMITTTTTTTATTTKAGPSLASIASICASRFVLAPLLSVGLMHSLAKLGLLGPAGTRARAIVTFVLLMEGCMPPAQNTVIMLQLVPGLTQRATIMAQLLTVLYALAVIPVTFLLSASLAMSGIMNFR